MSPPEQNLKKLIVKYSTPIAIGLLVSSFVFATTILQTQTTDTIETFRTNVNTSLVNLSAENASTSPTIGFLNATSTATSTFAGGIQINGTGNVCLPNGTCIKSGGITSLNGLSGATQTFSVTNSNTGYGDLTISSATTIHAFTLTASSSPTFGFIRSTSTAYIPALSNLTSNGFVKTGGAIGTLSVDTNTYLTATSLSATSPLGYTSSTGVFTCSTCVTAVTASGNIASSGGTTPAITFTGTLPIANGGTNATSFTTSGNAVYYDGTSLLTAPLTGKITIPFASSTAISIGASGEIVIPQGANPLFSDTGSVALDTTSNQLLVGTTTANNPAVFDPRRSLKFQIATTTLVYIGSFGASGTTTLKTAGYLWGAEFYNAICRVNAVGSNGTTTIRIGDGTTYSNFVFADNRPNGISTAFSGVTISANKDIYIDIGTLIGTVSESVSCDFAYRITRE